MNYALREHDGETVTCDSCGSAAPTGGFNWAPGTSKPAKPQRMLCEFCSTTMASRYTEYPSPDLGDVLRAEIWRAAACVFNMLRAVPVQGAPDLRNRIDELEGLLRELTNARPLLLYGDKWIERIEKTLAAERG